MVETRVVSWAAASPVTLQENKRGYLSERFWRLGTRADAGNMACICSNLKALNIGEREAYVYASQETDFLRRKPWDASKQRMNPQIS